jgi:hypothetical protein
VLPEHERPLYDLFVRRELAPAAEIESVIDAISVELVRARASDSAPRLEVTTDTGPITVPVRLLHGRSDRLVPFTETLRLEKMLRPSASDLEVRVLGLFGHSKGDDRPGAMRRWIEKLQFLEALAMVLRLG